MAVNRDELQTLLGNRYRLLRELGSGGMATVYLADDPRHGRQVAFKVLRADLAAVLGGERFVREIRTTAALQHPHILPLLDSGEAGACVFYTMPYVEGESLRQRLDRERQLSAEASLTIILQMADALQYAHDRGVVHRDIKPENILLSGGHAVLADFGIARAASAATAASPDRLTEIGISLGTPAYMSPEQAVGDETLDQRADQYSLACVAYEMLAGEPPFTGRSGAAVLARHLMDAVPPLATVRRDVPRSFATAIERALAKSPAGRFASIAEFAAALRQPAPAADDSSIVVLPFANLSPEPDTEFFADGLTDDVIMELSKIRSLRVISRNSAMLLKGTAMDTRAIGRALNVRYVLEGTVRRAGNNVRVTAQLIDAALDSHLWAERYSGTLDDILVIQEQIAGRIADALHVLMAPAASGRAAARDLGDARVRDIYHRARQEAFRFTRDGYEQSRRLLAFGLQLTGESAVLRAAEAKTCLIAIEGVIGATEELLAEAERLTELVRAAAPDSIERLQLDGVLAFRRGDLPAAAHHLSAALDQAPHDADTLLWLGEVCLCAGQRDPTERLIRTLGEVDPLNPILQFMPGWLDWAMGEPERGVASWARYYELDPLSPLASSVMVLIEAWLGHHDAVTKWLDKLEALESNALIARVGVALGRAAIGDASGAATAMSSETLREAHSVGEASIWVTAYYALLQNAAETITWASNVYRLGFMGSPKLWLESPLLQFIVEDLRYVALINALDRRCREFEVPAALLR